MPVPRGSKQDKATIARLKEEYVRFFEDLPIHKYACQFIGRDEDTVGGWRREDPIFQDAIDLAESKYLRKKVMKTSAEFQLERMYKSVFSQRQEVTGAEGAPLQVITHIPDGTTNQAD
jgi:hypothetical protein